MVTERYSCKLQLCNYATYELLMFVLLGDPRGEHTQPSGEGVAESVSDVSRPRPGGGLSKLLTLVPLQVTGSISLNGRKAKLQRVHQMPQGNHNTLARIQITISHVKH